MNPITSPQNLSQKYPLTYKAIRSSQIDNLHLPDSFLSTLQNQTIRYWPEKGVNSIVFQARFPDKAQLIRMADLTVKQHIMYWHPWHMEVTHKTHHVGKIIDWFTPPTGDDEWIDSLVRFTHMIDLAAAYNLTHENKYLSSFEKYLNSFSKARNKPGRHWKFLINVAVRLINLVRAYDLLSRVNSLPLSVHLATLESINLDINFLLNSLTKVRANGAFFATTALLIASEFLEDIFYVEEWRTLAEKKLYEILNTEIQQDLIEVEQVPMYHGQVVIALLDYCIILKTNGRIVNTVLQKTIKGMLEALINLCDPQGNIPTIGDSDRFSITYIVDLYNVVFKTESILNPITTQSHTDLDDNEYCKLTIFDSSGWVVARWNYSLDRQGYLLFDCSGKPKNQKSGHSHSDDLQFLLHTTSGAIFTDPGRFTYCTDFKSYFPFTRKRIYPKDRLHFIYSLLFPNFMALYGCNWKEYFKRTLSHNTISLNGTNQPGYANRSDEGSKVALIQHKCIGPLVLLQGHLDTSASVNNKQSSIQTNSIYQHQRTFLGVLPHLWIIVDEMQSRQESDWISSYHLDTGGEVTCKDTHLHLKTVGGLQSMHFLSSSNTTPILSIDNDWISHIYNKKSPSKTVRASINQASSATLVTVIQSHENNDHQINGANTYNLSTDNVSTDIFHLTLTNGKSTTNLIINPSCKTLRFAELEFDAMLSLESRTGQDLSEAGFLGGTFLRSNDFSLKCRPEENGLYQNFAQPK